MDFESILSTIQPFLIMFAALFAAFLTATWISVVIWTFRDIRARSRDIFAQILGTLMVLVFFPLFPLPGLAIYFILRPRETLAEIYERSLEEEALLQGIEERLACPGCNRRIEEEFVICPTCHTRLKKACPACGRLLHLRWNICPYCGAVQTAAKAIPSPVQPFSIAVEGAPEALRIPGPMPRPKSRWTPSNPGPTPRWQSLWMRPNPSPLASWKKSRRRTGRRWLPPSPPRKRKAIHCPLPLSRGWILGARRRNHAPRFFSLRGVVL
jgi:RNA polymerase subunit RPABC4/transcription elongation factor Spt4